MPIELEQPCTTIPPAAAISALLLMMHQYAMQSPRTASARLAARIYRHLESLSQREDLPAALQRTCDELSDAWLLQLGRQRDERL